MSHTTSVTGNVIQYAMIPPDIVSSSVPHENVHSLALTILRTEMQAMNTVSISANLASLLSMRGER